MPLTPVIEEPYTRQKLGALPFEKKCQQIAYMMQAYDWSFFISKKSGKVIYPYAEGDVRDFRNAGCGELTVTNAFRAVSRCVIPADDDVHRILHLLVRSPA